MKIVNFIQGTEEWKAWRFNGITASDISVIMGSNSYKSIHDLWVEKVSQLDVTKVNVAMQHGNREEPFARSWIEAIKNINLLPHCVVNDTNEVYRCSLDGYDALNNEIYEIKCPYSKNKVNNARLFDDIDLAWIHQVQWQLFVTGCLNAFIAVWDSGLQSCHFIAIKADPLLHKEMKVKADEFWIKVLTLEEPPLSKDDLFENNDESYLHLLDMYYQVKSQIANLAKEEAHLKALITKDGIPFKCFNYKITQRAGPTSYDTKQMAKDGINLNDYIKPKSNYFIITRESTCKE